MRSITDVVRHFKQNWTEELSETAIAQACREAGMTWRETLLNPVMTIQVFFVQILHGNVLCANLARQYGHRTSVASDRPFVHRLRLLPSEDASPTRSLLHFAPAMRWKAAPGNIRDCSWPIVAFVLTCI